MELFNSEEFEKYVKSNYKLLITLPHDYGYESQIGSTCDACHRDAFLKIHDRAYNTPSYSENPATKFTIFFIECPSCKRKSFLNTAHFLVPIVDKEGNETDDYQHEYYMLYRLPVMEETYSIKEIPDNKENKSLRETISEASFCLTSGKYTAATIMYRRGIQVIAKHLLGAKGKTLYQQLEWLKTNQNKLKIDLTEIFHDNAKLIKDIGNQGAHPEDDLELHTFSKEDAYGLHDLFLHLTHEIFVKPAKLKALQDELKEARKLGG